MSVGSDTMRPSSDPLLALQPLSGPLSSSIGGPCYDLLSTSSRPLTRQLRCRTSSLRSHSSSPKRCAARGPKPRTPRSPNKRHVERSPQASVTDRPHSAQERCSPQRNRARRPPDGERCVSRGPQRCHAERRAHRRSAQLAQAPSSAPRRLRARLYVETSRVCKLTLPAAAELIASETLRRPRRFRNPFS